MSFSPLLGSSNPLRDLVPSISTRTTLSRGQTRTAPAMPPPIIAFCHLSWDGVWQRPQQFLSRFARTRPVLFVETYCSDVTASSTRVRNPAGHSNVTVLEMHLPSSRWHDGNFIDSE